MNAWRWYLCGAAVLMASGLLMSRGITDELPSFDVDALDFSEETGASLLSEATSVEAPVVGHELKQLRDRYMEAAGARAELMSEEELRQAVDTEQHAVAELRAAQMLKTAKQKLQQIAAEFAGTQAAQRAEGLLQVLRRQQQAGFRDDVLEDPLEDDHFRNRLSPNPDPISRSRHDQTDEDPVRGSRFDVDF